MYQASAEIVVANTAGHRALMEGIRRAAPDVLVVALGHGQQEKWLERFLPACPSVRVALGVGGALDYLAGRVRRAPPLLRLLGLEWLWRLWCEPRRWRRMARATVIFPLNTLRWCVRMRLRYRESMVGCILNGNGEVLVVERAGSPGYWQLPQGGRERRESPQQAVLREMREELGTDKFTVLGQSKPGVHRYVWKKSWPKQERGPDEPRRYGYKGQRQTVFYLRFTGTDEDIVIDNKEHTAWRWVPPSRLLAVIHPIRRRLAAIVLEDLRRYAQ
jgi:8-oxo-dGTP pyrophosphatase MutT (NUDIX family)